MDSKIVTESLYLVWLDPVEWVVALENCHDLLFIYCDSVQFVNHREPWFRILWCSSIFWIFTSLLHKCTMSTQQKQNYLTLKIVCFSLKMFGFFWFFLKYVFFFLLLLFLIAQCIFLSDKMYLFGYFLCFFSFSTWIEFQWYCYLHWNCIQCKSLEEKLNFFWRY